MAITRLYDINYDPASPDYVGGVSPPGAIKKLDENQKLLFSNFYSYVDEAMDRTFYVDAVNGDDNNPGTEDAPFKTLKKAIYSVPVGGIGLICLLSDIISDEIMYLYNRHIRMVGNNYTVTFPVIRSGSGYNTIGGFRDAEGSVCFRQVVFSFDVTTEDSNLLYDSLAGVVAYNSHYGNHICIWFDSCTINLPDKSKIFLVKACGAGNQFASVGFYNTTINSQPNSYFVKTDRGCLILSVYSANLQGSKTTWADLIYGIKRDANGTPRNVMSNIVL